MSDLTEAEISKAAQEHLTDLFWAIPDSTKVADFARMTYKFAHAVIAADRAKRTEHVPSGWISVKDRLPELDVMVAIHVPSWGKPISGYLSAKGFRDYDGELTGSGFNAPTHWTPLPPPPKEAT